MRHDGSCAGRHDLPERDSGTRLFRQRAPFDFEDVTASVGPIGAAAFAESADINRDDWPDLVLGTSTGPKLMINNSGVFEDHTELLVDLHEFPLTGTGGLPEGLFLDIDGDGDLDLFAQTIVFENLGLPAQLVEISIDIKPGSKTNSLNPSAGGVVPVAILGSETFDVADIDPATLTFGSGLAALAHVNCPHSADVNGDGYPDLLGHFQIREAGIAAGDREACAQASTTGGTPVRGCDHVVTRPQRHRSAPRPSAP